MELVDRVLCLPRECSLGKERLRKLQGSLHNGALDGQKMQSSKNPTIFPSTIFLQQIYLFLLLRISCYVLISCSQQNNVLTNYNYSLVGADLVKDAGEGAGCVAFEGELAVGAGPLEQHAGHAVPVAGPDSVSLQCNVGGCLRGQQE